MPDLHTQLLVGIRSVRIDGVLDRNLVLSDGDLVLAGAALVAVVLDITSRCFVLVLRHGRKWWLLARKSMELW